MTVLNNVYHFSFFWQKQESTLFQSRSVASSTQLNALVARAILRFFFFIIFSICYCAHGNKSTENVSFTPPLCPCAVWKPAFPKIEVRQWVIKHSYFVLMCSLGPTSIKDYVSLITYLHPSPSFPPSLINDRTDLKGRTTNRIFPVIS